MASCASIMRRCDTWTMVTSTLGFVGSAVAMGIVDANEDDVYMFLFAGLMIVFLGVFALAFANFVAEGSEKQRLADSREMVGQAMAGSGAAYMVAPEPAPLPLAPAPKAAPAPDAKAKSQTAPKAKSRPAPELPPDDNIQFPSSPGSTLAVTDLSSDSDGAQGQRRVSGGRISQDQVVKVRRHSQKQDPRREAPPDLPALPQVLPIKDRTPETLARSRGEHHGPHGQIQPWVHAAAAAGGGMTGNAPIQNNPFQDSQASSSRQGALPPIQHPHAQGSPQQVRQAVQGQQRPAATDRNPRSSRPRDSQASEIGTQASLWSEKSHES